MTKGFAASWLAAIAVLAAGRPAATAEPVRSESGRLQQLIARLASSDYVLGEPTSDSRPYVDPTPVLNAVRHVAAALAWGDVDDAARKAATFDYEVVKFTDDRSERRYFVLRENLDRVPASRGWGSYIVNRDSRNDVLVEVPHPLADAQTPEIGGAVFEQADAKGYLLAGAHRDKADVPDLVDSVFHQVHAAWVGPAARVTAWQIHGFASSKHSFPRDAHIVASTGDGVVAPEVSTLDALCEEQGLTTYVYNDKPAESRTNRRLNGGVSGVTFNALAGTGNEQGRHSRSLGGSFVHVELESSVRQDPAQREAAAAVIAAAMGGAPARMPDVEEAPVSIAAVEAVAEENPVDTVAYDAAQAEPAERLAAREAAAAPAKADDSRKLP